MTAYEEYKERLKVTEESTGSKSSGDCKPCRLKIAQDTFDTLTRGSQYLPTNETLPGYYKTVEELCYGIKPTNERMQITNPIDELYGRKMPENEPMDVIDMMYGRKMPKYKPVDVISLMYGRKMPGYEVNVLDSGINQNDLIFKEQYPCKDNEFPNNNQFIKNYLPTTPINRDCILFFYVNDPVNAISIPINIKVNSCCSKFTQNLWCNGENIELIKKHYLDFLLCIKEIFKKVLIEFIKKHPDLQETAIEQLMNQFREIHNSIIYDRDEFIRDYPYGSPSPYAGNRKDYCLCSKNPSGYPTYCCDPFYEDGKTKRPECWCPDGSLKNLCEDCEENVPVDLPLPFEIEIISKDDWRCWAQLTQSGNTFKIYYWVYSSSGDLIDSGDDYILKLPPIEPFNYERRLLPINIPKSDKCNIKIQIEFGCGWCCSVNIDNKQVQTNRKRIVTINIDNFSFSEWESKSKEEKKAFLDFNKEVDYDYLTPEFNTKDINCYCQDC